MGYKIFKSRRSTKKNQMSEQCDPFDTEVKHKTHKQADKEKDIEANIHDKEINHIIKEEKCGIKIPFEDQFTFTYPVENNLDITEVDVVAEVHRDTPEEREKHDWLDEPEKKERANTGNNLNSVVGTKETVSCSVQTDLDMVDIKEIESKVKELCQNITKEQHKLSTEWNKDIQRTRGDIQKDENFVNIEFVEIENIKFKIKELEVKLNVFFDKNFGKTITLLDKVTELYNEIKEHKNWERYLNNEISVKREEIKEVKLELKEEKEIHKSLKQEMIAKQEDFIETRHKLSAIEKMYKAQEKSATKQAETLNAVMAEIESLKRQQTTRYRKAEEHHAVTEQNESNEHVQSSKIDPVEINSEATVNNIMTEEFDIGNREREFDELMQFPVQESQEEEETEAMKYAMDDANFEGRYEFYKRQFEDLWRFSDED